jgi:hypothetical protein
MGLDLARVFQQFDPDEPLGANDPRYVDCLRERGIEDLFERLKLPLDSEKPRALFFSGVLGDGKTTILRQLQANLEKEEGDLVAFGEADVLLDLADVQYENILLSILTVAEQALRRRYLADVQEVAFRRLRDELNKIVQLPIELSDDDPSSPGPIGKISARLKESRDIRPQVRQRLRLAQSPTFLQVVNNYLDLARGVIQRREHRRLVVILDNLDRNIVLPTPGNLAPDEDLFIKQSAQVSKVSCHVIYTARLWLIDEHSILLEELYGEAPVVVPMIAVRRPDGTDHEIGLAKLHEVIERRLRAIDLQVDDVFSDRDSVREICRMSGGWLRGLMSIVKACCTMARARYRQDPSSSPMITPEDARAAVDSQSRSAKLAAAGYRKHLEQVAESHDLDGIEPSVVRAMLHKRMIYRYYIDGSYWYAPIPLLRMERGHHEY